MMTPAQMTHWRMFAAALVGNEYVMKVGPGISQSNTVKAKIAHIEIVQKSGDQAEQAIFDEKGEVRKEERTEDRQGFIIIVHTKEYELEMQQEFDVDDNPDALKMGIEAIIEHQMGFKIGGNVVGGATDPMAGVHVYTPEDIEKMSKPADVEDPEAHMDRPYGTIGEEDE